jgi:hypothetical protein
VAESVRAANEVAWPREVTLVPRPHPAAPRR